MARFILALPRNDIYGVKIDKVRVFMPEARVLIFRFCNLESGDEIATHLSGARNGALLSVVARRGSAEAILAGARVLVVNTRAES